VVNFEMPLFIADYLHRIGRVGRLGSVDGGIITNFVTKAYEADLVKNIERYFNIFDIFRFLEKYDLSLNSIYLFY